MSRVGLISDTHGLLRPEVIAHLKGCDHIIHAGDVGSTEVLAGLRALAPLTVVRGNIDRGSWAEHLQEVELVELDGVKFLVIHDLSELGNKAERAGASVVVAGHSHRPLITEKNGVTYVNPGSAGPRRFKLPVSAGEAVSTAGSVSARLVVLLP